MKKRVFSMLLLLVIMVSAILPNQVYAASKLKLSKAKATMEVDSKLTLKLGDIKAADIKWTSSDKKIASVSKAVITAKAEGTATITATYEKKKYTCKVTVVDSNKEEEKATPTPKPNKNEPTMGQKNALKKAKTYLEAMSFSKDGLIKQLEFEKYSHDDAVYAVDNCGADWKEQAVKKAKTYLEIMAFSKEGLIKQLEFEGFTNEQAVYAAEKNGY